MVPVGLVFSEQELRGAVLPVVGLPALHSVFDVELLDQNPGRCLIGPRERWSRGDRDGGDVLRGAVRVGRVVGVDGAVVSVRWSDDEAGRAERDRFASPTAASVLRAKGAGR